MRIKKKKKERNGRIYNMLIFLFFKMKRLQGKKSLTIGGNEE